MSEVQLMLGEVAQMQKEEAEKMYVDFVDKFQGAKTTDDCYTPECVFEAVAEWVCKEYGVSREQFVRPFYPGGDFEHYDYPEGAVVCDNPPFSILAKIIDFYGRKGIKFFLFAPTLTLFTSTASRCGCSIPAGVGITYENGACVNTSFVTNLEPEGVKVRTAPELYKAVDEANTKNQKSLKKELPKYSYPDYVITSAMVARWSKYGVDYVLRDEDCVAVGALDEQKKVGKTIFGKGFLLSELAAAERAAATQWKISEREKNIIKGLGKVNDDKGRA